MAFNQKKPNVQVKPPKYVQPPFDKAISAKFPTPSVSDLIIAVSKEVRTPGYEVQPYGTHHPDRKTFPKHKLGLIHLAEDGQTAVWFYVADRVVNDAWNFTLKYALESRDNPVYARTYNLPRQDYVAAANLSPDPVFSTLILTHEEEIGMDDEPEWASQYIRVVRVYELLPGALL